MQSLDNTGRTGERLRITFITNSSLSALPSALASIRSEYGDILDVSVIYIPYVDSGKLPESEAYETMMSSHIILCEIMGNNKAFGVLKRVFEVSSMPVLQFIGGSPEILGLTRLGSFSIRGMSEYTGGGAPSIDIRNNAKISAVMDKLASVLPEAMLHDANNWLEAIRYWISPAEGNLKNLLLLMAKEYGAGYVGPETCSSITVSPPVELPVHGIMYPGTGKVYNDAYSYLSERGYDPEKPTVGILYYGDFHYDLSATGVIALAERLSPVANVLPVFTGGIQNLDPIARYFNDPKVRVNAIVSLIWFRINGGPMGGDAGKTLELLKSIGVPVYTPITMYNSDLDDWRSSAAGISVIETMAVVAFPEIDGCIEPIPIFGMEPLSGYGAVKRSVVIGDRADRIAGRIMRMTALQAKPNKDKRIALVMYNYPPGESNIGSAAYLDTFKSVDAVLKALSGRGYAVKQAGDIKEAVLSAGAVNDPEFIRNDAGKLAAMPLKTYREWYDRLPEPVRADVESTWGAPPGTVMAGKEDIILPIIDLGNVALCVQPARGAHSSKDKLYHDKSLPPHHQYMAFYHYLRDVFKADALVHVGTHGTLEFLPGKEVGLSGQCYPDVLIGDVPHFYIYHSCNPSEAAIAKRRSYATLVDYASPSFTNSGLYGDFLRLEDMLGIVSDGSVTKSIRDDTMKEIEATCGKLGMAFKDIQSLHDDLENMKSSLIPAGLHVLGEHYNDDALARLLLYIVERDNKDVFMSWAGTEETALGSIKRYCIDGNGFEDTDVPEDIEAMLKRGRAIEERIVSSDEMGSLMSALEGKYVTPNITGDAIRTPEVYPTGCNSYQFDPRQIPAKAAYLRGVKIAENTLGEFLRENGRFPETIGVVLWGFETAKTRGETIGQIFAYMGLRVVHGKSWYPSVEVIPAKELGRPRIDVNVNICGFFRDMYPNLIKLISEGVAKVAGLDEDVSVNYVKKHSMEIEASGVDEAARLSKLRLFGPAEGEYGTGLTAIVNASAWDGEDDLAGKYTESMAHAYGAGISGVSCGEVYKKMLATTEMVSQVRDSNDYEISDLDHYYEFLGGLSKSVERASGKKPGVLVSDTTADKIRTTSAEGALVKGVYTRLLNPTWIDGMLKHDFHGGEAVADRVENLIGFAATIGVSGEVFRNVAGTLMFDERMLEALKKNNPYAAREISARLMEADKRGYWAPDENERRKLEDIYIELESVIEDSIK